MMQRLYRRGALRALLSVAWVIALPALAQDPRASEAQAVALTWLALTDANDAQASWAAAGAKFRNAITIERWKEGLSQLRVPLGATQRRTLHEATFARVIPGLPEGDYALLRFRTLFSGKPDAEESVTLERDSAAAWQVVGYVIR
jgi:hypothetical protein